MAPSMPAIARLITLAILLGFPGVLTPAFARASSSEDKVWIPEISTGCRQGSEALSRECVDRTWRRSSISPATSGIRSFSFCTLDVFVAVTARPSVPKDDACIKFTERSAIAIGC
jgi:hypothetical protein